MKKLFILLILLSPFSLFSQQVADTAYNPEILDPEYGRGQGPVVFIDNGHYNFHTRYGRYRAFAILLERDGYQVKDFNGAFTKNTLSEGKILVISNALNERAEDWAIPDPSAFSEPEIEEVKKWVYDGGSLFLIADHMPFGDASKDLAAAFGFEFTNGFVFHTHTRGLAYFSLEDHTLGKNIITMGRDSTESVDKIASFTGQAFRIPEDATSVLTFNSDYENLLPDTAWVFDENTARFNAGGWSQGAYTKFGNGRVVVFGEAAMFTAQLAGPQQIRAGMNSDMAPQNYRLLLNIIHWLDGKMD